MTMPSDLPVDPRTVALISTALSIATTVLGLAVGYIALRGYRRNRSRPMLFVSVGFVLVFWAPFLLFVGNTAVPGLPEFLLGMVGETSRLLGLVSILYGLRMPLGGE